LELIGAIVFFFIGMFFHAFWDAEAFEEGESNHTYKYVYLSAWLIAGGFLVHINDLIHYIVISAIYCLLWYGLFDLILNHAMGKDNDYKTGKLIYKWLSLILFIGLFVLYFKI